MGMKRTKLLWAFVLLGAVAWALIGCAATQPPETPTPVPTPTLTHPPTFTHTPLLTYTPTLIPTSTLTPTIIPPVPTTPPPALDTLLSEAGPLCEDAFFADPVEAVEVPIAPVLALFRQDYGGEGWAVYKFEHTRVETPLLPFIGARYAPEVRTLVCIMESRIRKGTYSGGDIPAYQREWSVRLVQWPEGTVINTTKLTGSKTPFTVFVSPDQDAVYGDPPYTQLLEWLFGIHGDPTLLAMDAYTAWEPVAFSPDGAVLAAGGGDDGKDIILWDVATGQKLHVLSEHRDVVRWLAFLPDGKTLVSTSRSEFDFPRLWDVEAGTQLRFLKPDFDFDLSWIDPALSPDGQVIALRNQYDDLVHLLDTETGRELHSLAGHTGSIIGLAFSPDGSVLASWDGDEMVKVWDAATGQELHTLSGHDYGHEGSHKRMDVALSPDGKTLATGTWSGVVRLWDLETGRVRYTLADPGHAPDEDSEFEFQMTFSPDGSVLAVFNRGDPTIWLWDVETGEGLPPLVVAGKQVGYLAFSPDGKTLASASGSTIQLWDVATWQALRTLTGHADTIASLVFSPDGRILASRHDCVIKLWDMDGGS